MKKPKTLTRKEAIRELINKHGLDYLNANNMIQGRRQISETDLSEIAKRLTAPSTARTKKPSVRKMEKHKYRTKRANKSDQLYSETKNYITSLDWGEL